MADQALDNTASTLLASKTAMYGGSIGALSSWLASLDLGFWISVLIGVGGLAMNWYFARKKDKRDVIEHKAYLKSLEHKEQCNVEQD
ncbi:holin [Acinetobacter brisouii]|uniref:holin n=1 Tax=Acinetobacter brisouii TaxID=396323 RepID=UPI0012500D2E|nr:holin [Acinetobacter brisouii]